MLLRGVGVAVGDQDSEQASARRRVAPGSVAEIARIGAEVIAAVVAGNPLEAWLLLAVEDVLLVGAMDDVLSPTAAYEITVSYLVHLVESGDYTPGTVEKAASLVANFVSYIDARYGVEDIRDVDQPQVLAYIEAPLLKHELRVPRERTKENRRWAVDVFFRTLRGLDLYTGDPLLDAERSARPEVEFRPLLDAEVERCRSTAWMLGRHPRAGTTRARRSHGRDLRDRGHRRGGLRPRRVQAVASGQPEPSARPVGSPATRRDRTHRAAHQRPRRARSADAPRSRPLQTGTSRDHLCRATEEPGTRWTHPPCGSTRSAVIDSSLGRAPSVRQDRDLEEVRRCLGVCNLDTAGRIIGLAPPDPEAPPSHRRRR